MSKKKSGAGNSQYKHGFACRESKARTYRIWGNMKSRCTNPNVPAYKDYGERGITVCARWMLFENFIADMGECPDGLMLERKDNNGNYDPNNCVWATRKEQNKNSRHNVIIEIGGIKKLQTEWADYFGINRCTVSRRKKVGKSGMELFKPVGVSA